MSLPRKLGLVLLYVLAVVGLGLLSAHDPNGLRKHLRLGAEVRRVREENRLMQIENARLRREAKALTGDPVALERAAREELGFVRPGEWIYRLDEPGAGP